MTIEPTGNDLEDSNLHKAIESAHYMPRPGDTRWVAARPTSQSTGSLSRCSMAPNRVSLREIYRAGLGATVTSVGCSVCTFTISQTLLMLLSGKKSTPELQSVLSVAIFVVGYWAVYFALRARIHRTLVRSGAMHDRTSPTGTPATKLFFVCASEIFWILSLGAANLYLLRHGYSANAAAALAQWGVNLTIWLPLLPLWEWFALVYLPRCIRCHRAHRE